MTIYLQWIICCTQTKEYELAKELAKKVLQYTQEGSFNWFKGLEVLIQLSFNTTKYQDAYDYMMMAYSKRGFRKLPKVVQEEWAIYEAYLRLLVSMGRIKDSRNKLSAVRIRKFINEVPTFSRDKSGMNVPIIVCYLISLLHLCKYNELIDKVEGYQKYVVRYLKEDEHKRTYYFFRMLLTIPKARFEYKEVKAKNTTYYEEILSRPVDIFNVNYVLEVIPYEHLWELILDMLQQQNAPAASMA